MIGIDPDHRIHASPKLLALRDGPTLDALRLCHGEKLILPRRQSDGPNRDRLALRFEQFEAAA